MKVGVLGGGRMGAGIAHAFLLAGCEVVVVERDDEAADAAGQRIRESIRRSVERGATALGADDLASAVHVGCDIADFADCELVVEAVPEDRTLKVDALLRIEGAAPDAAIATNTSSISIDDLAASLARPAQVLGLHFFNPVPASALVEIVEGAATAPALVERARGWVELIGKTPIVVRDSPGFASSRLGVALALEAIRMLESGVASAEDIDRAMELGYRHPVGPLRTTDIVGLDVRLGIAEELQTTLGERFAPPALLRQLVSEGKLGRKSGEGFYTWPNSTLENS
ncbi:3-hydroxyacyl-CoA dehydrogenase family protein [Microbacterium sp. Bi121]|uniref:3-hydroxyacyl-CoA dehydrogenase family protein n=1 Tax=Microbacterium sp. Bi121 TaxID=2822348 RepID=UPI0025B705E7|nr:3-hydroxyacyl-CoA dehydrogenase family protein [Microbacterium sp. Bi121]